MRLTFVIFLIGLTSCADISHINSFSSTSVAMIERYGDISFSATSYCHDFYCLDPQTYISGEITLQKGCDCKDFIAADKSMSLINTVLTNYFNALTRLSDKNPKAGTLTALNHSFDELSTDVKLGIKQEDIKAIKDLTNLLSQSIVSIYRREKLKKISAAANHPLTIIVNMQKKNIFFLENILQQQRNELNAATSLMTRQTKETSLIWLLNLELAQKNKEFDQQNHLLKIYNEGLDRILVGHQKLYDSRNSLKDANFRKAILAEASAIVSLIEDFKALRKQ